MIEILPQSSDGSLGFKVSGKLTAGDYEVLLPKIDEAIGAYGEINLLVLVGDLKGWDGLEAAKADFDFGTKEYRQVKKAAFIGDKKWQKWMIKIMDPFTRRTDERFFSSDQIEEAWLWIKEN